MTSSEIKKYLRDNLSIDKVEKYKSYLESLGVEFENTATPQALKKEFVGNLKNIKRTSKKKLAGNIQREFTTFKFWLKFLTIDTVKTWAGWAVPEIVVITDKNDEKVLSIAFKKIDIESIEKERKAFFKSQEEFLSHFSLERK